jgi:outer membrane protein assembly factor BamD (BamD/ComL family)
MKKISVIIKILAIAWIIVTSYACNNAEKAWENAQADNTVEAYMEFLNSHPESEFSKDADAKIELLIWENAINGTDVINYEDYIKKYPDGKFVNEAVWRIDSLRFLEVDNLRTIEAFTGFLKDFPMSRYADTVRTRILDMEWEDAQHENSIIAYQDFLNKYPDNKYEKTAIEQIEKIKTENFNKEFYWSDGFLMKEYIVDYSKLNQAYKELFDMCVAYSREEPEKGIIQGWGVGDKNGRWRNFSNVSNIKTLNVKEGGVVVYVHWISLVKDGKGYGAIIGFRTENNDKNAAITLHGLLAGEIKKLL